MKLASLKLCLVVAGGSLFLAGCPHTPTRPDPSATAIGMQPGGGRTGALNPTDVPVNLEAPGLTQRPEGFDANNQNRTALQAVYFDFDRSDIKQAERTKLQAAKEYLTKNPRRSRRLAWHRRVQSRPRRAPRERRQDVPHLDRRHRRQARDRLQGQPRSREER